jgi:primosomal protein N'
MRYLDVVPLRRVPWGLGLFTYCSNESVPPGSLVSCRFSGQLVNAVVWSERADPPEGIKIRAIEAIIETFWLTTKQRQFFDWVSQRYATPLPTLLYLYSLVPVKRARRVDVVTKSSHDIKPTTWVGSSSLVVETNPDADKDTTALIAATWSNTDGLVLILCPTIADVRRVASVCNGLEYTMDASRTVRTTAWRAVLAGDVKIVIGTAAAAFLPLANLSGVVVYREADPAAKAIESRPLLHLRTIARQLAEIHSCPLALVDFAPSVEAAQLVKYNSFRMIRQGGSSNYSANLTLAQSPLLQSPQFLEKIEKILGSSGRILVLVPRLGEAGLLACHDCAFVFTCASCDRAYRVSAARDLRCGFCNHRQEMPMVCLKCHGTNLREKQWTVSRVARHLSSTFTKITVSTFEAVDKTPPISSIIVSTTAALYQLPLFDYALRVFLDFDAVLQQPTLEGTTKAYRILRQLGAAGATIVETRVPEHLVFRTLDHWRDFIRAEGLVRKRFQLPPLTQTIKFSTEGSDRSIVLRRVEQLRDVLRQGKGMTISSSLAVPGRSPRRRFRHVVIINPSQDGQLELIDKIDYSQWTIDPDPSDFS